MNCTYDSPDYYIIDVRTHIAALTQALLECNMPRLTFLRLVVIRALSVSVRPRGRTKKQWTCDMRFHFKYIKELTYALEKLGIDREDHEFRVVSLKIEELACLIRPRLRIVDIDTLSVDDMVVTYVPLRGLIYLLRERYGH